MKQIKQHFYLCKSKHKQIVFCLRSLGAEIWRENPFAQISASEKDVCLVLA